MMQCLSCTYENPEAQNFCGNCGAPAQARRCFAAVGAAVEADVEQEAIALRARDESA